MEEFLKLGRFKGESVKMQGGMVPLPPPPLATPMGQAVQKLIFRVLPNYVKIFVCLISTDIKKSGTMPFKKVILGGSQGGGRLPPKYVKIFVC